MGNDNKIKNNKHCNILYNLTKLNNYNEIVKYYDKLDEKEYNQTLDYIYLNAISHININNAFMVFKLFQKKKYDIKTRFIISILNNCDKNNYNIFNYCLEYALISNININIDMSNIILNYCNNYEINFLKIYIKLWENLNNYYPSIISQKLVDCINNNNYGISRIIEPSNINNIKLIKCDFNDDIYSKLCKNIKKLIVKNNKGVKYKLSIIKYIDNLYDKININNIVIIDGANIGFSKNGIFNYEILINLIKNLLNNNYYILLVIHSRHLDNIPYIYKSIFELYENNNYIIKTPYSTNDDYYWLYSAFKFKCNVITNDLMKDHIYSLIYFKHFDRWIINNIIRFKINIIYNNIILIYPKNYSNFIHYNHNINTWYLPIENSKKWISVYLY